MVSSLSLSLIKFLEMAIRPCSSKRNEKNHVKILHYVALPRVVAPNLILNVAPMYQPVLSGISGGLIHFQSLSS